MFEQHDVCLTHNARGRVRVVVVEGCGRWQVLQATATMGCVARETYSNLINGLSSNGLLYANIIGICRGGGGWSFYWVSGVNRGI